eukprot:TRINITY_DN28668_c0_g1_i1.p1 TRINITY_DN28668_c0_g1~~TRINITY_DN28668_c0_g1_i1.p1  ORF type:complete len:1146 (-),score=302.99 TRINITY_DN28668_c0_g1_i1:178-3267(-)
MATQHQPPPRVVSTYTVHPCEKCDPLNTACKNRYGVRVRCPTSHPYKMKPERGGNGLCYAELGACARQEIGAGSPQLIQDSAGGWSPAPVEPPSPQKQMVCPPNFHVSGRANCQAYVQDPAHRDDNIDNRARLCASKNCCWQPLPDGVAGPWCFVKVNATSAANVNAEIEDGGRQALDLLGLDLGSESPEEGHSEGPGDVVPSPKVDGGGHAKLPENLGDEEVTTVGDPTPVASEGGAAEESENWDDDEEGWEDGGWEDDEGYVEEVEEEEDGDAAREEVEEENGEEPPCGSKVESMYKQFTDPPKHEVTGGSDGEPEVQEKPAVNVMDIWSELNAYLAVQNKTISDSEAQKASLEAKRAELREKAKRELEAKQQAMTVDELAPILFQLMKANAPQEDDIMWKVIKPKLESAPAGQEALVAVKATCCMGMTVDNNIYINGLGPDADWLGKKLVDEESMKEGLQQALDKIILPWKSDVDPSWATDRKTQTECPSMIKKFYDQLDEKIKRAHADKEKEMIGAEDGKLTMDLRIAGITLGSATKAKANCEVFKSTIAFKVEKEIADKEVLLSQKTAALQEMRTAVSQANEALDTTQANKDEASRLQAAAAEALQALQGQASDAYDAVQVVVTKIAELSQSKGRTKIQSEQVNGRLAEAGAAFELSGRIKILVQEELAKIVAAITDAVVTPTETLIDDTAETTEDGNVEDPFFIDPITDTKLLDTWGNSLKTVCDSKASTLEMLVLQDDGTFGLPEKQPHEFKIITALGKQASENQTSDVELPMPNKGVDQSALKSGAEAFAQAAGNSGQRSLKDICALTITPEIQTDALKNIQNNQRGSGAATPYGIRNQMVQALNAATTQLEKDEETRAIDGDSESVTGLDYMKKLFGNEEFYTDYLQFWEVSPKRKYFAKLGQQIAALQTNLQSSVNSFTKQLQKLEQEMTEAQTANKDANMALSSVNQQVGAARFKLEPLQRALEEQMRSLEAATTKLTQANAKLQEAEMAHQTVQDALTRQREMYERYNKKPAVKEHL